MKRVLITAAVLVVTLPITAAGEVTRFIVRSTRVVSDGRSFGTIGPYEEITGTLFFAVDPAEPANRLVVDLDKAAKNGSGRVEFSADVVIYRPRDSAIAPGRGLAGASRPG
jgi:hypothetical protein